MPAARSHRGHVRPRAVVERLAGRGDRLVDVGGRGVGHLADDLLGVRGDDLDQVAGLGLHPLAADEQGLVGLHGAGSHGPFAVDFVRPEPYPGSGRARTAESGRRVVLARSPRRGHVAVAEQPERDRREDDHREQPGGDERRAAASSNTSSSRPSRAATTTNVSDVACSSPAATTRGSRSTSGRRAPARRG